MKIRSVSRAAGSRYGDALRSAAYRGGRDLWNERTGALHKYAWREDVRDTGIVLPGHLRAEPSMSWARDPYTLWNTAEFAENQRNSRVARDYMMILPEELPPEQRRAVVYGFAQKLADRYGKAVDVALHDRRTGRARHYHAHLLATTRKIGAQGLLGKTDVELSGTQRRKLGITMSHREEFESLRALWEHSLQGAILQAGLAREVYDALQSEYGRGESAVAYRRRLVQEGFDLAGQQRRDMRQTRLTPREREAADAKQWANRKFRQIERLARREHQVQVRHGRANGLGRDREKGVPQARIWLPRWDVRRGLLNYWEVEPQVREAGQTPAMVPWIAKESVGGEPRFELRPERGPRSGRSHSGSLSRTAEARPMSSEVWLRLRRNLQPAATPKLESVQRWLTYRRTQPQPQGQIDLRSSIGRWLELRRTKEINVKSGRTHERAPGKRELTR